MLPTQHLRHGAARDAGVPGDLLDRSRRRQGAVLDALGLGPIETPARIVLTRPELRLRAYAVPEASAPAVLLVPAPIKKHYIWDLAPGASVVRQCLRQELAVYLIQWSEPSGAESGFGLEAYADRSIHECVRAIGQETGQHQIVVMGHSLGGTLAAIFAALHPRRVRGLVLLVAPLRFAGDAGAFAPLLAIAPRADALTSATGNVPGSLLDLLSVSADPQEFLAERWLDWIASLPDREALLTHLRVERWTLDETPIARQLFEDVIERLYREDRFVRGTLRVGGRRAAPASISAAVLSVVEATSRIVPPQSVLPFHAALTITDERILWYGGDTGIALQHVGPLVGRSAHRVLWPQIARWAHSLQRTR